MQNRLKILLFDVDGVIIEPFAYTIGINKTIEFLCLEIGLSNVVALLPIDKEIAYMEAQGTHDAWDITNIMFASIIVNIARYFKKLGQMPDLAGMTRSKKMASIKSCSPKSQRPDYKKLANLVAAGSSFAHPPDLALKQLSTYIDDEIPAPISQDWIDLLKDFLVGTRSAYQSYGTRIFQNIILGKKEFEVTYERSAQLDGSPLLESEDKVLINPSSVKKINKLRNSEDFKLAIYTARPCYPPKGACSRLGYSPEAEIALRLAGLTNIPLIGLGMMQWLAAEHDKRVEDLVKPNSTQAIAALLAAVSQTDDTKILEEAYSLSIDDVHPDLTYFNHLKNNKILVYVFEDIISGVKATMEAGKKLQAYGYSIQIKPLGIAQEENKAAALKNYCYKVYPSVNEALDFVFFEDQN